MAWNRMKEDTKDHYITKLLHTAEQGAVALSKAYKHSAEMQIKTADVGKERGRMSSPFGKKFTGLKFKCVLAKPSALAQKYP